jgi:hypothetical protein
MLNATSMFNHGDVRLPAHRVLRLFLVTPDMRRVHRSISRRDRQQFRLQCALVELPIRNLPCAAALGHGRMTLGIDRLGESRQLSLDRMLWQPLRRDVLVHTRSTVV